MTSDNDAGDSAPVSANAETPADVTSAIGTVVRYALRRGLPSTVIRAEVDRVLHAHAVTINHPGPIGGKGKRNA